MWILCHTTGSFQVINFDYIWVPYITYKWMVSSNTGAIYRIAGHSSGSIWGTYIISSICFLKVVYVFFIYKEKYWILCSAKKKPWNKRMVHFISRSVLCTQSAVLSKFVIASPTQLFFLWDFLKYIQQGTQFVLGRYIYGFYRIYSLHLL